jgi:hypothetical protein
MLDVERDFSAVVGKPNQNTPDQTISFVDVGLFFVQFWLGDS